MDIVIGATSPVKMPSQKEAAVHTGGMIEAQILNVRPPRKSRGISSGSGSERRKSNISDPAGSRVMVLLVPDGQRIPQDINSRKYKIMMRFVPVKA